MRIGSLIKALGGPTAVASAIGLSVPAIGNWAMRNAIPREHHLVVWRLATAKGIPWSPPDADGLMLVAAPVPAPPQAAPKRRTKRAAALTPSADDTRSPGEPHPRDKAA